MKYLKVHEKLIDFNEVPKTSIRLDVMYSFRNFMKISLDLRAHEPIEVKKRVHPTLINAITEMEGMITVQHFGVNGIKRNEKEPWSELVIYRNRNGRTWHENEKMGKNRQKIYNW